MGEVVIQRGLASASAPHWACPSTSCSTARRQPTAAPLLQADIMFQAVQLWHGAGACAQKRTFLALAAAEKVGKEVKAAHPVTVSACIASCTRCAAVMM